MSSDDITVYSGSSGPTLLNIMMNLNKCKVLIVHSYWHYSIISRYLCLFRSRQVYTYDPSTSVGQLETLNINKLLMRRLTDSGSSDWLKLI